jgi:hypothetical protein
MRKRGDVWCGSCYCKQCICELHRKEAEDRERRRAQRERYFAKHDWTSPEFAKQAAATIEVPRLN